MTSYIKNNHCYIGGIVFQIAQSAYIREPDHNHDLITLCSNADPITQFGNWFVEWGVEPLRDGKDLLESALAYCDCDGDAYATVRPNAHQIRCNNLSGYQLYWGDKYQQDMRVVFPHEEGLFFIHVVAMTPGTKDLKAISDVCNHEIVKTILRTVRREVEYKDITLKPIEEVGFSVRTYNALRRVGLDTIGAVLRQEYDNLYRIPGIGKKGLCEVADKMAGMGFCVEHMTPPERKRNAKSTGNAFTMRKLS